MATALLVIFVITTLSNVFAPYTNSFERNNDADIMFIGSSPKNTTSITGHSDID
jgi:hypothetical protein